MSPENTNEVAGRFWDQKLEEILAKSISRPLVGGRNNHLPYQ